MSPTPADTQVHASKDQLKIMMKQLLMVFQTLCKSKPVLSSVEVSKLEAAIKHKAFFDDLNSAKPKMPFLMQEFDKGKGRGLETEFDISLSFPSKVLLSTHVSNVDDLRLLVCFVKIHSDGSSMQIESTNLDTMFSKGWPDHESFKVFRDKEYEAGIDLLSVYRVVEQMEYSEACVKVASEIVAQLV